MKAKEMVLEEKMKIHLFSTFLPRLKNKFLHSYTKYSYRKQQLPCKSHTLMSMVFFGCTSPMFGCTSYTLELFALISYATALLNEFRSLIQAKVSFSGDFIINSRFLQHHAIKV